MLLNVSYNESEVKEKIEASVGKPFSLNDRWLMNGVGSPKLFISSTSIDPSGEEVIFLLFEADVAILAIYLCFGVL